jgi:CheY-like chemotaxis protein
MPILDGDRLLQVMRSKFELRSIPIVMVTADAVCRVSGRRPISHLNAHIKGDEARLDGLLSGADDYISKPFTAKQLLGRTHLQMQIGRRKAQLETKFEARSHELRVRLPVSEQLAAGPHLTSRSCPSLHPLGELSLSGQT